eukprot:gene1406-1749_t
MASVNAVLSLVVVLAMTSLTMGYPHYWAEEYAPKCTSLPTGPKDCHKKPEVDKGISVQVLDAGKPTTRICAGKSYTIRVAFPTNRFAFVTLSSGTMAIQTKVNRRCPNTMSFDKTNPATRSPTKMVTTTAVAPKASSWTIGVASATGACAPFL